MEGRRRREEGEGGGEGDKEGGGGGEGDCMVMGSLATMTSTTGSPTTIAGAATVGASNPTVWMVGGTDGPGSGAEGLPTPLATPETDDPAQASAITEVVRTGSAVDIWRLSTGEAATTVPTTEGRAGVVVVGSTAVPTLSVEVDE